MLVKQTRYSSADAATLLYLFVYTTPLPPHLAWLNSVLLPFPIIVSSLHFIPIWVTRKRTPA